jgi:hypothetical protein
MRRVKRTSKKKFKTAGIQKRKKKKKKKKEEGKEKEKEREGKKGRKTRVHE